MKSLILLVLIVAVGGCKPVIVPEYLPNQHCGEGTLISDYQHNLIVTPNGSVFEVAEVQRSPTKEEIKGSYSYNPNTNQLFVFQEGDMMPSISFKVKLIKSQ